MKKIILLSLLFNIFCISKVSTQIVMKNAMVNTGTCGADFFDSGGSNRGYQPQENYTITICSDDTSRRNVALGFDLLDIKPGDELCFYDGNTASATPLGCASDFGRTGSIVETTARNASGCMTITFHSNSSGQGMGWLARVLCIPSCQTVKANIVSSFPIAIPSDTGWVDACPNITRVSFKAKGIYDLNDISYHQSDTSSKFEWNFGDGTGVAYGTEVSHIYEKSGGYVTKLTVTDSIGCQNINFIKQRVRVASRPTFSLGSIVSQICAGQEVKLRGAVQKLDTSYQVSSMTNTDSFQLGQVRSEKLFIPDDGFHEYKTSVFFTDFNSGQLLTNVNDLKRIFVNMEHSYARDLEIKLICPNRQQVILNKYDVPTKTVNRIRIGIPNMTDAPISSPDVSNPAANPAGTGYEYAWTPTGTKTWRNYNNRLNPLNLPAGNYKSDDPLSNLIGCPLNGEWSIVVKDQFKADNGWIFYWGIDFEKSIYPRIETFTPTLVSHTWANNPTITSFMTDSIIARPHNAGIANYIYQVKDNFNCIWDTSMNINVLPLTNARCATCTMNFKKLRDTAFCATEQVGAFLNKSSLSRVASTVVFDAYPNTPVDGVIATLTTPYVSTIAVQDIFIPILTDPLTQIDSVCLDINSNVALDYIVQLKAPSGQSILLKDNTSGGIQQPIRNLCFTPAATRSIVNATTPLTGSYLPVDSWDMLKGTNVNGNWQLLSSVARGGHTDTIAHWSIAFQSGNALKYSWTPTSGLSCTNCATPTAKPKATTKYVVSVADSVKCLLKDTIQVSVVDSLNAPALLVDSLSISSIQFSWPAVPNATGYEVSLDNARTWITPNGNLKHTIRGLKSSQTVTLMARALGTTTCGARTALLSETSLPCIAKIGHILADSIPCFGGTSPVVNVDSAIGVQGTTGIIYKIDTFSQVLNAVFRNKIKAGQHTAVIIDGVGCTDTVVFYLGQPAPISITKTIDSVKCNGTSSGKISIVASGGVGPYVYNLNSSPLFRNVGVFDSLSAGNYVVGIVDNNRCQLKDSSKVYEPLPLSLNLSKQDVRCFGNTNGTVKALAAGGTAPYTYTWDNGSQTSTITGLAVGQYAVTLTDKNGCSKKDFATVASPAKLLIATLQDSIKCYGDATGRARARVTGGLTPYFFNWNNTQFDSIATGLRAGLQRVTVVDAIGCSDTASISVLQKTPIQFDSLITIPVACSNQATGSARVVVSGGTQPYRYTWLPTGATTVSITNLQAAKYIVNVRDANNCSKDDTLTVGSSPPLLIQSFNFSQLKCTGDATGTIVVTATGGNGTYSYRWNTTPVQTTDTIKNLAAGRYSVTVTDQNNCTVSVDTALSQPPRLDATISQYKNIKCRGDANGTATPSVTGGTPFQGSFRYIYKWNDPLKQDIVTAINLPVGSFTVTVTDANGCMDTANVSITQPATAIQAFPVQTKLSCYNGNTGEAQVTATGGAGNYTYRWSNLQNTSSVNGLARQYYSVTVTDINGCRAIDSLAIQTYDSITANITAILPRCYGTTTGSVTMNTLKGGAGNGVANNYYYRWNTTPAQTTLQANGLQGGKTYSVTVTDNEGCSNIFYKYLGSPSPILLSAVSKSVSCYGGADGQATINAIGTNNSFTFAWNDDAKQTTQQAASLRAGRYGVTVTDSTGCQRDTIIEVKQPSRLRIDSKTIVDNKCVGDTLGTISLNITGGVPVYNVSWSNGDTSASVKKLRSGSYIVTISDVNGCKLFDTSAIKSPHALDAEITTAPVHCFGDHNGTISIDAFGGTQPYFYSLNGKDFNGISQIVGIKSGSFDVYVKDANNCIWFDNVTITSPPRFIIEATPNITINLGDKAQLFASPQNNRGDVILTWKQPYDSSLSCLRCPDPKAYPLSTILYVVSGVDTAGCRASDSVNVTVIKQRSILVPTGFTPNEDLINDKLIVHGRNGTTINVFRIYDRWGELLYEAKNFKINDENAGWDGKFRGQYMNTGEYVWYIEAQYIDGAKETLKGHTTLIR